MGAGIWIGVLTATALALGDGCAQTGNYGGARNSPPTATTAPRSAGAVDDEVIAAYKADRARDYAEAFRLFQKIDAEPDPVAGQASLDYFTAKKMGREVMRNYHAANQFFANRAGAREKVGEYYEKGRGVPQDYRAAASWYAKATDRSNGDSPSMPAKIRLAFLYANGLGGARDRAKARELLVSLGPSDKLIVVLLDHDALPRSLDDLTPAYVQSATARISDAQVAAFMAMYAAAAQNRSQNHQEEPKRDMFGHHTDLLKTHGAGRCMRARQRSGHFNADGHDYTHSLITWRGL